jgi:hypothetical protein
MKAPSLVQEVPIMATTSLEVAVYRGQYIRLPATPPPSYSEKELVSLTDVQLEIKILTLSSL